MYRRIFCFMSFLMASYVAFNQGGSIGFHVIGNHTSFQAETLTPIGEKLPKWKTGYGMGGNYTYELNEKIGFRGEMNVERLGAKYNVYFTDENGNVTGNGESKISLDYVAVPLLVQLKTGDRHQFLFHVGTAFKLLVNQSVHNPVTVDMKELNIWPGFDKLSDYNRTDQSVQGGVGYSFPFLATKRLCINGRYEHGLLNVSKKDKYLTGNNRSFSLFIGVQI